MSFSARQTFDHLLECDIPDQPSPETQLKIYLDSDRAKAYQLAGLLSDEQQRHFRFKCALIRFIPPVLVFGSGLSFSNIQPAFCYIFALNTFIISHLIAKAQLERAQRDHQHSIEFYIPVVMERLVMAVQAGLDLLSAIRKLAELSQHAENKDGVDPVTRLLIQASDLCEAGLPFEKALSQASDNYPIAALRHAFLHLAHAHRDGGGVVGPLRELADASQSQFQDKMEEFISRLPVRATAPLALCFLGLILALVTVPLVAVLDFTMKSTIGG